MKLLNQSGTCAANGYHICFNGPYTIKITGSLARLNSTTNLTHDCPIATLTTYATGGSFIPYSCCHAEDPPAAPQHEATTCNNMHVILRLLRPLDLSTRSNQLPSQQHLHNLHDLGS